MEREAGVAGGVGVSLQAELVCEATSGRAVPAAESGGIALACEIRFQAIKFRFVKQFLRAYGPIH